MKKLAFAVSPSLLAAMALMGCGGGGTPPAAVAPPAATTPAVAQPQILFEGPGVPGTVSSQELFTANLDGSHVVQVTNDGLNKFLAHFSPDGTRLVYTKFVAGKFGDLAPTSDIFLYTFATATETRLTNTGIAFQPAWSPDGLHIAYGNYAGTTLYSMNADGSGQQTIGQPTGQPDDVVWHDTAWASDNWIYFVVKQTTNDCFKVRLDKIRPDGTSRTQVSGGGTGCTPPGVEPYGDADPGISADGQTVYSSRGLAPLPADSRQTLRHLYAYASGPYAPGKVEYDISAAMKPDCTVGVPKGSPDGTQILVFLFCPDDQQHVGVTLTNLTGTTWTFLSIGFGPDWNPATKP
jgi:hypothetical protein